MELKEFYGLMSSMLFDLSAVQYYVDVCPEALSVSSAKSIKSLTVQIKKLRTSLVDSYEKKKHF